MAERMSIPCTPGAEERTYVAFWYNADEEKRDPETGDVTMPGSITVVSPVRPRPGGWEAASGPVPDSAAVLSIRDLVEQGLLAPAGDGTYTMAES